MEAIFAASTRAFEGRGDVGILQQLGVDSFAVLPVCLQGALVGCVYLDRRQPAAAPDTAVLEFLGRARDQAGRALQHRQKARVPADGSLRRTWTAEQKCELVVRLLRGEPLEAVSLESAVASDELDGWRRDFLTAAVAGLRQTG